VLMSAWIAASIAVDLWPRLRPVGPLSAAAVLARARLLPRPLLGMMLAHLGVAAFAFGVSMVRTFEVERDVTLRPGDTAEVAGHAVTLRSLQTVKGPNYDAVQAAIDVRRGGTPVALLHPEKRTYRVQGSVTTEAAIDRGLTRDLYVSLGEPLVRSGSGGRDSDSAQAWIVRIYCKPFVAWIWGGCVLMALGGALAASDRRYRVRQPRDVALIAVPGAAAGTPGAIAGPVEIAA
ncbi:MAG TPA: cytochrome c-type biogenesis CcmF C-terminal domain-containing protein, partial [Burkholderiaceae bacterium]|nr:cytochrome c-type biogenesis CcmF C-terminal domain-containing protein [Burkholderiaceae bacterium]